MILKIVFFIEITIFTCYNLLHRRKQKENEMRNYKFYGTTDGRVPMKMPNPADFGDNQKEAMAMYRDSRWIASNPPSEQRTNTNAVVYP